MGAAAGDLAGTTPGPGEAAKDGEWFVQVPEAKLLKIEDTPENQALVGKRTLIVELADNHARHVWLQQEGAYHVGLAVGHRLRLKT